MNQLKDKIQKFQESSETVFGKARNSNSKKKMKTVNKTL